MKSFWKHGPQRRSAITAALIICLGAAVSGCIYSLYRNNDLASTTSLFDVKGYAIADYKGVSTPPDQKPPQFVEHGQTVYLLARDWNAPPVHGWLIPWRVVTTTTVSTSVVGFGQYDWVGYQFHQIQLTAWAWRVEGGRHHASLMVSESSAADPLAHIGYLTGFVFDNADALSCYIDHLGTGANVYDTGGCGSMSSVFDMWAP
jgi:hypothetical protein